MSWTSLPGSSVHGILQARILEGLPFPLPENLPDPEITLISLTSLALTGGFFTSETLGKPLVQQYAYSMFFFFQLHCLFFQVSGGQSLRIGFLYTPI